MRSGVCDLPSETLESHLENIAWIALSISLLLISTSAMNNLSSKLSDQSVRATTLLVKECIELSWRTGCTLKVSFPNVLGAGKLKLEVKTRKIIVSSECGIYQVSLDAPIRDMEIILGKTYRIMRTQDLVEIQEVEI